LFHRLAYLVAFAGLIVFTAVLPARAAEGLSPSQTKAVEGIIKDYLMTHPEVIFEAVQAMKKRDTAAAEAQAMVELKSNSKALRHDPDSFVGGNPDGNVTVVEFFDYRCGYCKKVHPVVAKLLESDKNIRLVYKEFPILGPQSKLAAIAAIAALRSDPGKYLDFHNALMTARGDLTHQAVQDIAAEVGLDVKALTTAMRDPKIQPIVARNYQLAQVLGITGTPGFVIGDTIVPGYIDLNQMRELIEQARTECKTC